MGLRDMSGMIERVARALCRADGCDPDHESDDSIDSGIKLWTRYERDARAAIAAMREPTRAMLDAEQDCPRFDSPGSTNPDDVWRAMIDEALK